MDNQPTNPNTATSLPGALIFMGGMVIALSVLIGIFFLIKFFKPNPPANLEQTPRVAQQGNVAAPSIPNTQLVPTTVTTPQAKVAQVAVLPTYPPAKKVDVQTCTQKQDTKSLIDKLMTFNNGVTGTFRGVATKAVYNDTKKLAILELTSRDSTLVTTFDVQAANITLLRLTKTPIELSNDIHAGSPIIIGFKCSPKYENKFIITFIKTAAD